MSDTSQAASPPHLTDSTLELSDRVALLTFSRDDVRNALTGTSLARDIIDTVRWINDGADVSALVITGGGHAFSAGGNIKDIAQRTGHFGGNVEEVSEHYRHGIQRMAQALLGLEVPVVAAVNGAAVGAGFDLCCMCDVRFAAESAQMGETFINLGLIPGDGGAWLLQQIVGYQRAADLTFTGRLIDGREAASIGLVLEAVPATQLIARAMAWAKDVGSKPVGAVRMTKRLLRAAPRMQFGDFLDHCALMQGVRHNAADHAAAVASFVARRQGSKGKPT